MAEYIAFDENVEVLGAAVSATIAGITEDIDELLSEYGFSAVDPDEWYRQTDWLALLKALATREDGGSLDMVSVGMKIPEKAVWPDGVKDALTALQSIGVAYDMNHRGGDYGYYQAQLTGDNEITVTCENPYPSDFDYGIIYSIARRFLKLKPFQVIREDSPSRLAGDDLCVYTVTW